MLLSIIIPTRNEEKTIESTLRAITDHLTEIPFEIIVVDEDSSDKTVEIAKRHARVLEYHEPVRKTIAWGKDWGAREARGDMLLFIDADVQIPQPNELLNKALKNFEDDPQLVGLTVNLRVFPDQETMADRFFFGMVNIDHWINNNLTHQGSASGEFQMIPKKVFEKVHGYKDYLAVAEDNDMFKRLAGIGRTKIDRSLTVFHTGRRGHEVGWPRLLWEWFINYMSVRFFDRSHHKEWYEVR